jgi:colicin import membrane protein
MLISRSGLFLPFLTALFCHLLLAVVLWFGWNQSTTIAEKRVVSARPQEVITAVAVNHDPIAALKKQQLQEMARKKAEQEKQKKNREDAKKREQAKKQEQARKKEEARKQALIRKRKQEEARKKEAAARKKEEARKREEVKKKEEARKVADAKRKAELKKQQLLKAEAAKKKEQAEKVKKAQAEAKKAKEAKEAEAQRQRETKLAAAKAKAQKEAQAVAEAENKRKAALEAERKAFESALAQEEAFIQELDDQEKLGAMQALIKGYVEQNWSRPPTTRPGMQAVLKITLLPTGEVQDVRIIESSGNVAFDRSAQQAVHKAGPFRELIDLQPHQRDAFREFNLLFKPEDI